MTEKIYRKNENSASTIRGEVTEKITAGVEGPIERILARVFRGSKERNAGSMILKTVEEIDNLPETSKKEIIKKYNWLKKRGFPVVPTFRHLENKNKYLMTDASSGKKLTVIDKHFPLNKARKKGVEITNLEKLHEELREIALRAFNNGDGVLLGSDSYSLIYDPNTKEARIMLIDITRGTYIVGNYQAKGRNHDISEEYAEKLVNHAIGQYFS